MGGVIVTNEEWAKELRGIRVATGAVLHPFAGYLLHRGLQTLGARVQMAQASATLLAQKLKDHPFVSRVYYPGFQECDPEGIVGTQMRGPGAMIAFSLPNYAAAAKVMESVKLLTPAVSLGSVDTLIQHPASLTHQVVNETVKDDLGITAGMLRISVGLEDVTDLWVDLEQALELSQINVQQFPTLKAVNENRAAS
jgi:methionine-gamma-lyase